MVERVKAILIALGVGLVGERVDTLKERLRRKSVFQMTERIRLRVTGQGIFSFASIICRVVCRNDIL